ncbi:MAG: hypothetical protein WCD76_11015 [Pyrinomonadaceae bacterium]
MNRQNLVRRSLASLLCALVLGGITVTHATAQEVAVPMSSEELLQTLRQMPKRPGLKEELVKEIRRRGINFTLTNGLRSVIATKSGNDADVRRTLEEAERRYLNPTPASALPPAAEGQELLDKARAASLEAAGQMPDFVVKQLVTRAYARGASKNWGAADRLTVGVSYRASGGEQYKLLMLNGLPTGTAGAQGQEEKDDYSDIGGTSSTGEFVTMLALLFADDTKAEFKLADTDTLKDRRTLVYEYEVKQSNSKMTLTYNKTQTAVVGYRGRLWIDRENNRVLRLDSVSTDIPAGFPITATTRTIDYDWVTIAEQKYLLPSRAVLEMTARERDQIFQSRNDIRFRNYQKYGTEIKIIEEDIIDDEGTVKPPPPEKKPGLKP